MVEVLTASFAPGDTEACVEFVLLDDALALEGDETFTISFEPPAGTNPGASTTVTFTIIDDDGINITQFVSLYKTKNLAFFFRVYNSVY